MGNFHLNETWATDIQTDFRFQLIILPDANLGITEKIVGYIQQTGLPNTQANPITWSLPGGMKNYQAGKREIQAIETTWVTATSNRDSVLRMCEKWGHATYDLNTGTNIGKANYCTDSIWICLKSENDTLEYAFHLLRAQMTNMNYGQLNSDSNELLKVNCSMIYDNYEVKAGGLNGVDLKNTSI